MSTYIAHVPIPNRYRSSCTVKRNIFVHFHSTNFEVCSLVSFSWQCYCQSFLLTFSFFCVNFKWSNVSNVRTFVCGVLVFLHCLLAAKFLLKTNSDSWTVFFKGNSPQCSNAFTMSPRRLHEMDKTFVKTVPNSNFVSCGFELCCQKADTPLFHAFFNSLL